MSSILDIDLDYFNLMDNPVQRLSQLLAWAACPVTFVVENHHQAFRRWMDCVENGRLREPQYILHVDEHHDMMDEAAKPNIANFVYHAMRTWPQVRVHWLVEEAIDSPSMWLSEDTWMVLSERFTFGARRPRNWPKPDLVSVCTSPEFVSVMRRKELMTLVEKSITGE
jgi:hypothetical protein